MAIIEKGTWTLNPTFSSEVNPPINISIKLDGHSSFFLCAESTSR